MSCSICYDYNINDNCEYTCRICSKKPCDNCLGKILLSDKNFTFCIIKNLPIIYSCCFCKTENRLRNFDNDIKQEVIKTLEIKLNIIKIYK